MHFRGDGNAKEADAEETARISINGASRENATPNESDDEVFPESPSPPPTKSVSFYVILRYGNTDENDMHLMVVQ